MTDELLKLVVRKNELYVEWKTTAVDDPLFEQRKRNFRTYDNMVKYYMCSILTKRSTCRKNKKMRFLLI